MHRSAAIAVLSDLSRRACGVFRGRDAVARGVRRAQLAALVEVGVLERVFTDTYRLTAVARSDEQLLRAGLLWGGPPSAADGRSAGWWYGLQGIRADCPEIVLPGTSSARCEGVCTRRVDDFAPLMIRCHRGVRVVGVEATITRLAHLVGEEALEIAFEDARRQALTSMLATAAYLDRHACRGRRGIGPLRAVLMQLDPKRPSRSTLEVKTRRLLVANGITDFVREYPLEGPNGTRYFDFAFLARHTILETNGKAWHADPADYEPDNDKWSIPGQHGFKVVFATWDKVTRRSAEFIDELRRTLAAEALSPARSGVGPGRADC